MAEAEIRREQAGRRRRRRVALQSKLISILPSRLFPDDLHLLLHRRLSSALHPVAPPSADVLKVRWQRLKLILISSTPMRVWAHLKTQAGAWITSRRVHILTHLTCRFGCAHSPDSRALSCLPPSASPPRSP
eukprot:1725950-Pyramimonas_sp.AAC.1